MKRADHHRELIENLYAVLVESCEREDVPQENHAPQIQKVHVDHLHARLVVRKEADAAENQTTAHENRAVEN